jgi:hypothetical protein
MAEAAPKQKFLLIKVAFPGASLVASFNPNWDRELLYQVQPECVEHKESFSWCNESFYGTAVADIKQHLAKDKNAELAGVLAVQGEKEARLQKKFPWMIERYGEILMNTVRRLRRDTGRPDLPFVTVETFNSEINKEMQKAADTLNGVTLLHDKKGPSPDNIPRWSFNPRHFDTEGQRRLGSRFAEAVLWPRRDVAGEHEVNEHDPSQEATLTTLQKSRAQGGQPAWWAPKRQCDISTPDGFDESAWELAPGAQPKWACGLGMRNADANECLAAVVAATDGAANGRIKYVDVSGPGVPPGCSYSRVSGAAMFNKGVGSEGSQVENYRLACTPTASRGGDKVLVGKGPSRESLYLPRLFSISRSRCAGTVGNYLHDARQPCTSRGPVCKAGTAAANGTEPSGVDAATAVVKADWAFHSFACSSSSSSCSSGSNACPAGTRNAALSDCLTAVQIAAKAAGVTDVQSHRIKVIDDTTHVPSGCSYSPNSRQAIFNHNRVGGRDENYQLVCAATVPEASRSLSHFGCTNYDSILYIPYQGAGGLDDRIWMLSHASLLATSLCARIVTSSPKYQLVGKHNNFRPLDTRFWWDRYFDLGDLGDGTTVMVSDGERGPETNTSLGNPQAASYFPRNLIGPSTHANVTEAYKEARRAAVAQTPFTWQANEHVWYPHFWLSQLRTYDLDCDKGINDDFVNPNNDDAFPEFNNGRPWSFFSESGQVRDHAVAALAKLGVNENDLHTLHIRRGDVANNCNTSAAYLSVFMNRCDVLSPMQGDAEALVFFTDETDPTYLADLTAALSLPRWGGRVYNGDQAVMDVMSPEDKEDNYFVYAVASSIMASSKRQWEVRSTKRRCRAEDTCANPLLSKADAEAELQAEKRELVSRARVKVPVHGQGNLAPLVHGLKARVKVPGGLGGAM